MKAALVFLGGGAGAVLRYAIQHLASAHAPWPTLAINVVGSLVMGVLFGVLSARAEETRLLLLTGVLGGFTTFSAFSLDVVQLWQRGAAAEAAAYAFCSVFFSVAGAFVGLQLTR